MEKRDSQRRQKQLQTNKYMILDMSSPRPLADAILNDVHQNKVNVNIIITGRTQIRKSTEAVAFSFSLDPSFNFEKDFAIIKTKDMMNALTGDDTRGTVKLLDEIGLGMDHHYWFTFFSKIMVHITESFGFEGKIIIATVPYQDLVNSDLLKFFHIWIDIIGKDENRRFVTARVMTLEWDQRRKVLLRKYPRGRYPDGRIKTIKFFRMSWQKIHDNGMEKTYFDISTPLKKNLQYDMIAEATQSEIDSQRTLFNPNTYTEEILKRPQDFLKEWHGRKFLMVEKIMNEFHVGVQRATRIKVAAEDRLFNVVTDGTGNSTQSG